MKTKKCKECGAIYKDDHRFCAKCGILLIDYEDSTENEEGQIKNQSIHQMGKQRRTPFSFYDPFVGFGQRGRFVPWLISNMGKHAETLRDAVIRRFVQRRIPGTKIVLSRQSNKGLSAETRNYYIVQRNSIRIGLYISRFGKDLYISMVTYFKGSINMGKVFILIVMVLLIIFYYLLNTLTIFDLVGLTSINNQTQGIQNDGSVLFLFYQTLEEFVSGAGEKMSDMLMLLASSICCLAPIVVLDGLALIFGFFYSIYRGIKDKDFLYLLRSSPNEFQIDDIVALEIAVEETIRQGLDAVGIDRNLLTPIVRKGWRERLI